MPRGIYERKPRKMCCRSFYIRKDGTMYVQAGHDRVHSDFANTEGHLVRVKVAGDRVIVGVHTDTKKCGIVLGEWFID